MNHLALLGTTALLAGAPTTNDGVEIKVGSYVRLTEAVARKMFATPYVFDGQAVSFSPGQIDHLVEIAMLPDEVTAIDGRKIFTKHLVSSHDASEFHSSSAMHAFLCRPNVRRTATVTGYTLLGVAIGFGLRTILKAR